MKLYNLLTMMAGGLGSGCNPSAGKCGRHPGGHGKDALDRKTKDVKEVNRALQKAGIKERVFIGTSGAGVIFYDPKIGKADIDKRTYTPWGKLNEATIRELVEYLPKQRAEEEAKRQEAEKLQREITKRLTTGDPKLVSLKPEHMKAARAALNAYPKTFTGGLTIKYGESDGVAGRYAHGTVYMDKSLDAKSFKDIAAHEIGHHVENGWVRTNAELAAQYNLAFDEYNAVNTYRVSAYQEYFDYSHSPQMLIERRLRQERFAEAARMKALKTSDYKKSTSRDVRKFLDKLWRSA